MNDLTCPYCDGEVKRLHRRLWMRLIPFSIYVECQSCYSNLLFIGRSVLWSKRY